MEEGAVFLTGLLGTRCWLVGGPLPGATWTPGLGLVAGEHLTSETLHLLFMMFRVITCNGSTDSLKA